MAAAAASVTAMPRAMTAMRLILLLFIPGPSLVLLVSSAACLFC
jgi:hypothetical protein